MKIKEIERTMNVSWSPPGQYPILLAAGTAAQQLDASFNTSAALEIYSLSLGEPGLDMELCSSVSSNYRFHKVAWGGRDPQNGVIVGGCDGGHVQIYSASKLLSKEDALLSSQNKHKGPVRALDFNNFQSNLLATGASESEILIWDLNNVDTPMLPGAKSQPSDDVLWISWNKQVEHILATAFATRCVVWDLRKNEPIIKLSDSTSRVCWKVVAWHPEVATQLCLASEDDQTPFIQLWDLRFATSPLKVLERHKRGVLSIAWCPQDPDLLVSCGKDDQILCWNPNNTAPGGEVVCEITTSNQWNFDVSWCPRNPALIAASSFDGHVSIYSLTGGQQQMQTSNKIADSFPGMDTYVQTPFPQQIQKSCAKLLKPPKWFKKPVKATFGFGGKLVSFVNQNQMPRTVYISQIVTEQQLVNDANALETTIQYGQYSLHCENKAAASISAHEQCLWKFLGAWFKTDRQSEFSSLLGFSKDQVGNKLSMFINKVRDSNFEENINKVNLGSSTDAVKNLSNQLASLGHDVPELDPATAFDNLVANKDIPEPIKILTGDDNEGLVSQALLMGDIEAAVELCLKNGWYADAIILATAGSMELLERTRLKYLEQKKGPLSMLISAVVTEDWSKIVKNSELDSWKQVLVAALTHCKTEDFPVICELLGARLENEGHESQVLNAQLCYICAGNVNKFVESWSRDQPLVNASSLQKLAEMVVIFRIAVEHAGYLVPVSETMAKFLCHYAELLASQGNLGAALTYLEDSENEQAVELRDRIYVALHGLQNAVHQHSKHITHSNTPYTGQMRSLHTQANMRSATQTPQSALPNGMPQSQYDAGAVGTLGAELPKASVPSFSPEPSLLSASPRSSMLSPAPSMFGNAPAYTGERNAMTHRKPYVIDPSVRTGSYSGSVTYPSTGSGYASVNKFSVGFVPSYQAAQSSAMYCPSEPQQVWQPKEPAAEPQRKPAPISAAAAAAAAASGWNDPPLVKNATRNQPKTDYVQADPITHPIYGVVPQEPISQSAANMPFNAPQADPMMGQPYQLQPVHPTYVQEQQMPVAKAVEPCKPKNPIPEEHMHLQTVLDELRNRCTCAAQNPQLRRKLDDVARKLECLYDALRDRKLSSSTLRGLHDMVQMIQIGDYPGGLNLHTQLVSGPDFSQIASFMPGLKVLLQLALQLGVYLQ